MENERIKALKEELRSLENRKKEIQRQICEEKISSTAGKIIGKYFFQKTNYPDEFYIIRPTAINPYDTGFDTMVSAEAMCINMSQSPHVSYRAESCTSLGGLVVGWQEITEAEYNEYKKKAIEIISKNM